MRLAPEKGGVFQEVVNQLDFRLAPTISFENVTQTALSPPVLEWSALGSLQADSLHAS
jgi:hypothetical protein